MNIYVSNLDCSTQNSDLRTLFQIFGRVESVQAVVDPATGHCKGYGFIDMPIDDEGILAIAKLNGRSIHGKKINVHVASVTWKARRIH